MQFFRLIEVLDLLKFSSYQGLKKKFLLKKFLKCMEVRIINCYIGNRYVTGKDDSQLTSTMTRY